MLITIVLDLIFNSIVLKKLALYASHNQHVIVRKGLDNPGAGRAGAFTFQDKHIGQ